MLSGQQFSTLKYDKGTPAEVACAKRSIDSFGDYYAKYIEKITARQLVDGLDSFYADYKNRGIRIRYAVWLVVLGIAGEPEDALQERIELFRKSAAEGP